MIGIRKTTEEFLQDLKDKGNYYEDQDYSKVNYINDRTKVIVIDKKLGTEHLMKPNNMLNCSGKCSIKSATNKTEYFLKKLKYRGFYIEDYDYSKFEYEGMFSKVVITDKRFNSEHLISTEGLLLRGDRCTVRNAINKTKYLVDKVKYLYSYPYDYSKVKYVSWNRKVIIIDEYGFEHLITPDKLLWGSKCSVENVRNKTKYFEFKSKIIHGKNRYDYSDFIYIDNTTKGEIKCNVCVHKFEQNPNSHLSGRGCLNCSGKIQLTTEEFIEEIIKVHGNSYDYSELIYTGPRRKVIITCKKCNNRFEQISYVHRCGFGCPKCKQSKGENKIEKLLISLNLKYENQKTFSGCKNVHALHFDFHVPEQNLLIEYQGIQHYDSVDWFGGEEGLKSQQLRDQIKLDYCKTNNIDLLIIPYTEFNNIENIIKNIIKNKINILV